MQPVDDSRCRSVGQQMQRTRHEGNNLARLPVRRTDVGSPGVTVIGTSISRFLREADRPAFWSVLGEGLRRAYPLDPEPGFLDLLARIDEAERDLTQKK